MEISEPAIRRSERQFESDSPVCDRAIEATALQFAATALERSSERFDTRRSRLRGASRNEPQSLRCGDACLSKAVGADGAVMNEVIPNLEDALRVDPQYGRAHALLAWCHALNATYLWTTEPELDVATARYTIDAAAGLIDDDPTALTAAGPPRVSMATRSAAPP
jgi:hypothetical protein